VDGPHQLEVLEERIAVIGATRQKSSPAHGEGAREVADREGRIAGEDTV
jgi:hypothetical protein